jgi:hypothetical protein
LSCEAIRTARGGRDQRAKQKSQNARCGDAVVTHRIESGEEFLSLGFKSYRVLLNDFTIET